MVILITDNDVYYELRTPGITTIGRGSSNDVVPESRSISKSHAVLTLQLTKSSKLEMWIEDLNSTNGTFLGISPMEVHKILDKEKVVFGDYLRFGHSSQYFRILESMLPGTTLLSEAPQDVCSNDSIQDYLDRNEVQSASVYRGEHGEFDEFQQDIESSHDRDEEDSLHPRQNLKPQERFSRSTPVPYYSVNENLKKATEYQRKSAEYPRVSGREKYFLRNHESHQSEPNLFVTNERNERNERKDLGPDRFPETSRSLQNRNNVENVILPVKYPTADNTQQHPVLQTTDPPRIGSKDTLWDSPFPLSPFPLSPDDGQESQIFPESSPESSNSPQRFHNDFDCEILSRNISNDPSINHSSIFNTKNYAKPSKKNQNVIPRNPTYFTSNINSNMQSQENSTVLDETETENDDEILHQNDDCENKYENDNKYENESGNEKRISPKKNFTFPTSDDSQIVLQNKEGFRSMELENRKSDNKLDQNNLIINHDELIQKRSTERTYDKNNSTDIILEGRDARNSNNSFKQKNRNSNSSSNNFISSDEKNENESENKKNKKNNYSQFFITKNPNKENSFEKDYLHQNIKSDLKSNYLPIQKNTHDNDSQDWGFGLGLYKQNQIPLYSGNRNSEIRDNAYQNLLISNNNYTKIFPDIINNVNNVKNDVRNDQKIGNCAKTITSSMSASAIKNNNNNNNIQKKNFFRENKNKMPFSKIELENDVIDHDKFASLINEEISRKVSWILGPSSTDWKSSNIKEKIKKDQGRQSLKNFDNDVIQNENENLILSSIEREKILNEMNDIICDMNNLLKQSILATIISEKENKDRKSVEKKSSYESNKEYVNKNEEKNDYDDENNDYDGEFKNNRNRKERLSGNAIKIRKSKEDNLMSVGGNEWMVDKDCDNINDNVYDMKNKEGKKKRRNSKIKGTKLDDALHGVIYSIISGAVESLKNLIFHPFIIALNKNENISDSRYKIGQYLNVSVRRLNELLVFLHAQNNGFGGDIDINEKSDTFSSQDVHATAACVLSSVLDDIYATALLISEISENGEINAGTEIKINENTKEKFTGKNEKNSEEYSKPLISSMDIKCALRDYLNTEMGNKNNSQINYNSKLKLNNEELELRDSNEKLKENKNKIILPSDLNNQKLIPNNGINTEFRNDNSLNSKNINSSERELFDRIRQQEGKGGYVKNKLRRVLLIPNRFILITIKKFFLKWKNNISAMGNAEEKENMLLGLQNKISQLASNLKDLSRTNETVSALLTEKILNRELTAINAELRLNVTELSLKLGDVENEKYGNAKKQELAKHYLVRREEELARYRRESRTLQELFRNLFEAVGPGILEKLEITEKKKNNTESQEEKNGNSSADNYLKNLGITLLPKKFSNRNIFPKNERFCSLDSYEIISEKEKFRQDYFNRKNRSESERERDGNDDNNNVNNSYDNNNNFSNNSNYNNNNNNNSSLNNNIGNNNIDNNNSSSTRNSYQRSKNEEKISYENQNFNHLSIGKDEKADKKEKNISSINLIPKNKIDAQTIILLEIRRLSVSLTELQKNKIKLELKTIAESSRSAQLMSDSYHLKNKILDQEKVLFSLIRLLKRKFGEKGIQELSNELEELGTSAGIFLRESEF